MSVLLRFSPAGLVQRSVIFCLTFLLIAILPATNTTDAAPAPQAGSREITFPTTIQWNPQGRANLYRLQIAADERFHNVYFDGRVSGSRYVVKDLSPGYYYWRVATAESTLGAFSAPVRFFVSGGVVTAVQLSHGPGVKRPSRGAPPTRR